MNQDDNFFITDVRPTIQKRESAQHKAEDNLNVLLAALLITVMLLVFSVLSVAGKDREYSENENRYLSGKPQFSASSVLDGKFMKDTESYLSDQFFGRDSFVKTRTNIDIFLGKKEINDVYIGKRHFLFEKPAAYDEERVGKTLEAVNELTEEMSGIHSYMAIAPDASEVLDNLMPRNAPTQNQTEQIETIYSQLPNLQPIDLCAPLKAAEEQTSLYYRTDHHWTASAAHIAFEQIAAAMALDTTGYTYTDMAVTNTFQGTLASSSGVFSAKDTIYITVPEPEVATLVSYVQEKEKTASMFDSSKLEEKSKYDVFFGGNYAQINIETDSASERTLLIVKDSYANCVVPMLTPYFKNIIMVDPRYYMEDIRATIEKEGVTDILWLYNANTFLNDTSIAERFE